MTWPILLVLACLSAAPLAAQEEPLYTVSDVTPAGSFTAAEGPAVDGAGNLYAVNFSRNSTIGRITPDGVAEVFVDLGAASIGNGIRFDRAGRMLVADWRGHNVLSVDLETRQIGVLAHEPAMNQPNDLAIGADDRLYASDPNWGTSTGQLWRVDPDGSTVLLEAGMGTTNGIEVSADESRLYVNESVQRRIWVYDLRDGEISNKRLLVEFPDFGLDGMRCDVAGNLYVTRHGKGVVAVVSPEGDVLREIEVIGEQPTNVAFGGPDGRTVFVTVHDRGNVQRFRTDTPGRSWALRVGTTAVRHASWGSVKAAGHR